MKHLNISIVEGTLAYDPEIVNGCCTFSVDTSRDNTSVAITVRTVGRLAEVCQKYLKAGNHVMVSGQLQNPDVAGINCIDGKEVNFIGGSK